MAGGPVVNGMGMPPHRPGDMNNNGLSGPGLGSVKASPISMQAPSS